MPKDKPTYKELNGTSRIGDFLRKAADRGEKWAPALLDIAGTITGREALSGLADKIRGTQAPPQDKEVALALIQKDIRDHELEVQRQVAEYELDGRREAEITGRWTADAGSDSWLARNVRPLALAFSQLAYWTLVVLDSLPRIDMQISDVDKNLMGEVVIAILGGFFILRSVDKFTKSRTQ